jgi:diphthine-ammonia ligase
MELVFQMIDAGIENMILSCNVEMGEDYLGKIVTKELALVLQQKGIDACGENGEYHTLVLNCPLFKEKITLPKHHKQTYEKYCFIVWEE